MPPKPVVTRWSTWLEAAFYYAKHYEIVGHIVNSFDCKEAICIEKSKKILLKPQLKNELTYLFSNFTFITEIQTKIQ